VKADSRVINVKHQAITKVEEANEEHLAAQQEFSATLCCWPAKAANLQLFT
jgi:hypothetical protein